MMFVICHTPQLVISINIKLRTQDFAIFASNRLSAFLQHSNVVESHREEREIFIVYKWSVKTVFRLLNLDNLITSWPDSYDKVGQF